MKTQKKTYRNFSIIAVIIVILVYIASIVVSLMGNIGLTLAIIAFNSVFVVVLFFIIKIYKSNTSQDESETTNEDKNGEI